MGDRPARLPTPLVRDMTEAEFQDNVVRLAKAHGWLVCHVYPGRTATGKVRTNTTYKGFPDLTLLKRGRLVFLELKAVDGTASPEQRRWIALSQHVPGVEAYIVDPRDWPAVHRLITQPRTPGACPSCGHPTGT